MWVVLGESGYTMDIICVFWHFILCFKSFVTGYASSSVVTLHIFCLHLVCVLFTLRIIDTNFIFVPSDSPS